jgi:DNA-binding beta-propeller fold protein YncE
MDCPFFGLSYNPSMKFRVAAMTLVALASHTAGSGEAPYRLEENWGPHLHGVQWGETAGLTIDAKGRLYAFTRTSAPVIEFDRAGNVLKTWGDGLFVYPHGIRIDRNGFLWLTDARGRDGKGQQVFKYSRDGKLLMTLGTAGIGGDGPDTFNGPTDVAVAPNGDIFVSDGHVNNRIVKFSKSGKFIKQWGKKGANPGEFNLPHTLFFDSRGRLLVGDRTNKRIQLFDQDGTFIDQWTQFGSPSGMFIDRDDTLYVVDYNDKKRLFIGSAKDGSIKYTLNDLTLAEGIAVDKKGVIYVSETVAGKTDNGLVTGHMVRKIVKTR